MRGLIVVCLLAAAVAVPQGYDYPQKNTIQIGVPKIAPTGTGANSALPSPSLPSQPAPANSIGQEGQGLLQEALRNTKLMQAILGVQNSYRTPSQNFYQQPQQQQQQQSFGFPPPNYSHQQQQQQLQQQQPQQQQYPQYQQQYSGPSFNQRSPVVTKDIYVHVSPDEPSEKYLPAQLPVAPPRKHYRIVFIKAPTPSVNAATVRVNQAPAEEKTIIYVLTKKPDPLDLQTSFQDVAPKPPSKPEVYFIKYKTQEEAQHAQRTIQAQYDLLGGTTQVSDEGVAPVSSVIGALDQQQGSAVPATGSGYSNAESAVNEGSVSSGGSGSSSGSNGGNGVSGYLPPIVRI